MAADWLQQQIQQFLDEASEALRQLDWGTVSQRAQAILALDPDNANAQALRAAAERAAASADASTSSPGDAPVETAPAQPDSFADGRYIVKRFLGEGGKKLVYLAHDELLDRDVAFALIKTEGLDDVSRTRVSREAQAMGRLGSHPHIVTVYDLGDHDGQPYMVTELMGGGDVEGLIEDAPDHRLPLEQAIKITVETCRGLEFAHERGIIHRDLKPGNVWLTDDGTAKIGDFGLAVATDRSRLTQEGMMVGTVSYMPPEQATGGAVTPKADLYSLGAMLYEMITGRPPFLGDDSVAIIGQHLNTSPVAPTWHNSQIPNALDSIVMRLLEKNPDNRPASAADVREALEGIDLIAPGTTTSRSLEQPAPHAGQINPMYRQTFVGREAEVQQLHNAFDGAMSGNGCLIMVVGEPGIGKTTISEQIATYVTLRGGTTLVGHCYEEGSLSLPYLPFVEAMRSYVLSRESDDLKKELGSGASDIAKIVSEVRDRVDVEPRESSDPEEDRYRLMQAVTVFLRNASAVQPILIVLEDLHDADRATLDMLIHVARNLSGSRLMIVGTYRDIEVDRSHPLSGALAELRRLAGFSRITLRGLTADEVHRMLSAIADQDVPWGLAEAVHRQTEGNPLFVQEVVRYLLEEGLIARDKSWQSTSDISLAMIIPEGLRDVIGRRLSRLNDDCNRMLSIAAVIGREFRLDVLQRVAETTEEELYASLEEAQGAAVIEERTSTGGIVTYRFTHAFFRQTLYEEMIAPRRIRLHQQVGQTLEDVYASRLDDHAEELADHFSHSSDSENLASAIKYSEMAAIRARSVYAYGEAARLLEQALQILEIVDPNDKEKRCDLLLFLGNNLLSAGSLVRVYENVAPEAFELAESLGDRNRGVRACLRALVAMTRYGLWSMWAEPEFTVWAERASRTVDRDDIYAPWADVYLALARHTNGKVTEAWALAQRAWEQAKQHDDPTTVSWAAFGTIQMWGAGQYEERLAVVSDIADMPRSEVNSIVMGGFLFTGGIAVLSTGDRDTTEEWMREFDDLAHRVKDNVFIFLSSAWKSMAKTLDGSFDDGIAEIQSSSAAIGDMGFPATVRLLTALCSLPPLLYLGRLEDALTIADDYVNAYGLPTEEGKVPYKAVCLAHMGRDAEAGSILHQFLEKRVDGFEGDKAPAEPLLHLLEAAVLIGDHAAAQKIVPKVEHTARFSAIGFPLVYPTRILGAAAALLGDNEKARAYYQQALEVSAKLRNRPEIALIHLHIAELLLEHYPDENAEAQEHLDFAIAEFQDMKMQPSLERALRHRDILKA